MLSRHFRDVSHWRPSPPRCPCRKSDPDVLVVETAENLSRKNPANSMNYT
jgi:hypothetical protein